MFTKTVNSFGAVKFKELLRPLALVYNNNSEFQLEHFQRQLNFHNIIITTKMLSNMCY